MHKCIFRIKYYSTTVQYTVIVRRERAFIYIFIWRFYVAFNTVQVISRRVVWKGRGNQYIQFARVLYCKLPTNGKQLPAFPLKAMTRIEPQLQSGRRECYHSATVAPKGKGSTGVFSNVIQEVDHILVNEGKSWGYRVYVYPDENDSIMGFYYISNNFIQTYPILPDGELVVTGCSSIRIVSTVEVMNNRDSKLAVNDFYKEIDTNKRFKCSYTSYMGNVINNLITMADNSKKS